MMPEDQGEPREPGWGVWLLMGTATLFSLGSFIGILARLFGFLG